MSTAPKKQNVWVAALNRAELKSSFDAPGRWTDLVQPSESNLGMMVDFFELQPGERTNWREHLHPEACFVISGRGRAKWRQNNELALTALGKNQLLFMPGQVAHDLENTGNEAWLGIRFRIEPPHETKTQQRERLDRARSAGEGAWVATMDDSKLAASPGILGRWKRFVLPSDLNCGMIVVLGELPPHARMTWHAHPEPEIFFVLAGEGRACWEIEGREQSGKLLPGSAFYKTGQVRHDMENTGDQPLRGIAFKIQAAK